MIFGDRKFCLRSLETSNSARKTLEAFESCLLKRKSTDNAKKIQWRNTIFTDLLVDYQWTWEKMTTRSEEKMHVRDREQPRTGGLET